MKNWIFDGKIRQLMVIVTIGILVTISILIQLSNNLMIFILNPVRYIDNDIHNRIIWSVINDSYEYFDIEYKKELIGFNAVNHIPSYEIAIHVKHVLKIQTIIISNALLLIYYMLMHCIVIIYVSPSLYIMEKRRIKKLLLYNVINVLKSVVSTHMIWTQIYWQICIHNYYEHDYYEIDIVFDIGDYVLNYFKSIYVTIILLTIWNRNMIRITLFITLALYYCTIIELLYFYLIVNICKEKKYWLILRRNKL
jgi:hypothetical protein